MSQWTHIFGTIRVIPMGRTQAEKTYILQTVLEHLPVVTGFEEDMEVYVNQESGYDTSLSVDEFGYRTNNLRDHFGRRSQSHGCLYTQDRYLITVSGDLRDRDFDRTYRDFINWLCRLSKRILVYKILVEINEDFGKQVLIHENSDGMFHEMYEWPSWSLFGDKTSNWCEYLMWHDESDDTLGEACTVCSADYHQEIITTLKRYHSSFEESQQVITTRFCPNCGRELIKKA